MVIVNCDQDHRPEDLKPKATMASPESDTPAVIAPAMLPTTDTPSDNADTTVTESSGRAVVDTSVSEVWYLKPMTFAGRRTRVITQNFNGSVSIAYCNAAVPIHIAYTKPLFRRPCSFIAICDYAF